MIGILGGSFDPVHHGHLRLAVEVLEALQLDHVRLVPLNQPNGTKSPVATGAQRLEMLRAAVDGEPRLRPDDRELRRGGISYTVETLQSLREELPDRSLCLILGTDALQSITTWRDWGRLLTLSHIVVAARPGAPLSFDSEQLPAELVRARVSNADMLRQHRCGSIYAQPLTQLDISSTYIRKRLRDNGSVRYLLPDAVLDLIQRHGPYRDRNDIAENAR